MVACLWPPVALDAQFEQTAAGIACDGYLLVECPRGQSGAVVDDGDVGGIARGYGILAELGGGAAAGSFDVLDDQMFRANVFYHEACRALLPMRYPIGAEVGDAVAFHPDVGIGEQVGGRLLALAGNQTNRRKKY